MRQRNGEIMDLSYKKTIPRIGQGGFILQTVGINDSTVQIIFDCGTLSAKSIIEKEIMKIDKLTDAWLVISHLHDDHINCIPMLKAYGVKIKKIFLPNINHDEIILSAAMSDSPLISEFILNPNSIFPEANIVRIDPIDGTLIDDVSSSENFQATIRHTSNIKVTGIQNSNTDWRIRFFVNKNVINKISEQGKRKLASIKTIDNLLDNQHELFDIYSAASKPNFNYSSMMAFVYLSEIHEDQEEILRWRPYCCCPLVMCTGDIKISSKKMSEEINHHYQHHLMIINDVVLPHHGSDGYFIYNPFPRITRAYSQTGPYAKYGHPGTLTESHIESLGAEFYNITSDGLH
jgi:hypothetical protein